jgi:hypothetical protein
VFERNESAHAHTTGPTTRDELEAISAAALRFSDKYNTLRVYAPCEEEGHDKERCAHKFIEFYETAHA